MKRFYWGLMALLVVCFAASTVQAGVNERGTLVIHADPDFAYSEGEAPVSGIGCPDFFDCETVTPDYDALCDLPGSEDFNAQLPHPDAPIPTVVWVFAAFPAGDCPRVSGLSFGLDYEATDLVIASYGAVSDFEVPDGNWPNDNTGTSITWGSPRTSGLFEVYWFFMYAYYDGTLTLKENPAQGGEFGDDSIPSVLDTIAGYGVLGIGADTGSNPLTYVQVTPTIESTWGQIKARYGE